MTHGKPWANLPRPFRAFGSPRHASEPLVALLVADVRLLRRRSVARFLARTSNFIDINIININNFFAMM